MFWWPWNRGTVGDKYPSIFPNVFSPWLAGSRERRSQRILLWTEGPWLQPTKAAQKISSWLGNGKRMLNTYPCLQKVHGKGTQKPEVYEKGSFPWARNCTLEEAGGQTRNSNGSQCSLLKEDIKHLCCYCSSEEMMWVFSFSSCLNMQNWLIVDKYVNCCYVKVYYVWTLCPFLNRAFYFKDIAGAIVLPIFSKEKIAVAWHCSDC